MIGAREEPAAGDDLQPSLTVVDRRLGQRRGRQTQRQDTVER
jgi:hypothetical protein